VAGRDALQRVRRGTAEERRVVVSSCRWRARTARTNKGVIDVPRRTRGRAHPNHTYLPRRHAGHADTPTRFPAREGIPTNASRTIPILIPRFINQLFVRVRDREIFDDSCVTAWQEPGAYRTSSLYDPEVSGQLVILLKTQSLPFLQQQSGRLSLQTFCLSFSCSRTNFLIVKMLTFFQCRRKGESGQCRRALKISLVAMRCSYCLTLIRLELRFIRSFASPGRKH
jgi:hypothetical protein